MNVDEAIIEACAVFGLAYHSMGDYQKPADGFCSKCPYSGDNFQNDGHIFDYVRGAVVEQLRRDGYEIADGFDKITGREITEASE